MSHDTCYFLHFISSASNDIKNRIIFLHDDSNGNLQLTTSFIRFRNSLILLDCDGTQVVYRTTSSMKSRTIRIVGHMSIPIFLSIVYEELLYTYYTGNSLGNLRNCNETMHVTIIVT